MIDRSAKKSFTMWILKRYYLIDGVNQLFAVIYLHLFILEYHFFVLFLYTRKCHVIFTILRARILNLRNTFDREAKRIITRYKTGLEKLYG